MVNNEDNRGFMSSLKESGVGVHTKRNVNGTPKGKPAWEHDFESKSTIKNNKHGFLG